MPPVEQHPASRTSEHRQDLRAERAPRSGQGGRRRRGLTAAAVASALALIAGVVVFRVLNRSSVVSACTAGPKAGPTFQLTPEEAQNAAIISGVALKMGLPDHAVSIALATALQESRLHNLTYGDQDSVGLFQQRPSQGWGTRDQILDPVYSATAFYTHLEQVPGWTTMAVTAAAQAVQRSASPTAYAGWESEARTLAIALTGESPAEFTCRLASFAGPPPPPSALAAAANNEMGSQRLGTALGSKLGWSVASWVVAHAWNYHIHQVTYGGWTWTAGSGRWTPASRPTSGPSTVQYS